MKNVIRCGGVGCLLLATVFWSTACSEDVSHRDNSGDNNLRVGPGDNHSDDGDAGPLDDTSDVADATSNPIPDVSSCLPGENHGCATEEARLVCNADGTNLETVRCPAGQYCLQGECGENLCVPGTQHCADTRSVHVCNSNGDGFENVTACPDDMICESGSCKTICDLGGKGPSYIGCEYWTVDLDQYPDPTTSPSGNEIPHAIVVSNPGLSPATITFESRAVGITLNVPDPVVAPGSARAFTMPRLDVDGTGITQNAIHVRSTFPVIAHQFNPLNNESVYSNDASLLLPVSALGKEYLVMNWPTQPLPCLPNLPCHPPQHAYVTIVATSLGTTNVLVNAKARIASGNGINEFPPGVARSFSLEHGDVLNLEARAEVGSPENDLTGTSIVADQPIAVFAGHEEAVIGDDRDLDSCCADHLEQQLFPVNTWGTTYVAPLSPGRGEKKDHWRILAGEDNVTITTDPPQPGANNVTLNKGEFVTFFSAGSFEVHGTGKISVGQFLVSQGQTSAVTGDPAFVLIVPAEQFREDYHLLTPNGYTHNFVSIIRPAGTSVQLDGVIIADGEFSPVGSGTYEVANIRVEPGVHVMTGGESFGIMAYGFDRAVSYGYPGGLNLVGDAPEE